MSLRAAAKLVQPYILRRLKTDKSIIADLPDKTEVKAFCHLSRKQAALYQAAVDELEQRLKETGEGSPGADWCSPSSCASSRFAITPRNGWATALTTRTIAANSRACAKSPRPSPAVRKKLLVFTQFKEIIAPLERLLGAAFGRPGLVLHGEKPRWPSARNS